MSVNQAVEARDPDLKLATADQGRSGLGMGLLKTARPKQWSKNLLVFAAPGAAGILTQITPLVRSFFAFLIFCVVASGTYFVNDAIDAEADRRHPTKRNRPIASGMLSPQAGWVIGVALLAAGASASVLVSWKLGVTLGVLCVTPILVQLSPQTPADL
jgi:decaprenyl-phosphate phosphoribosyltransferase